MHQVTVHVNPVGPSTIGWSQAAGMPGTTRFQFRTPANQAQPNLVEMYPQLVLRPFTSTAAYGYDIEVNDPTGAAGIATIPGSVMLDRFHVEVYERNAILQPQRMLAYGRVDINGYGYIASSRLASASYEVGPQGPMGPQGPTGNPGERGSRWYTGPGAPTTVPEDRVTGDMYLDETTGDVWRWDATLGEWVVFKGV